MLLSHSYVSELRKLNSVVLRIDLILNLVVPYETRERGGEKKEDEKNQVK
jgi:hypothetical protein